MIFEINIKMKIKLNIYRNNFLFCQNKIQISLFEVEKTTQLENKQKLNKK